MLNIAIKSQKCGHLFKIIENVRRFSVLKVGVDEAGRGSVLGPLVISSVLIKDEDEDYFRQLGVKDSKQMSPEQRFRAYDKILERCLRSRSIHISSKSIDKERLMGSSMNRIEENHIFELLSRYMEDPVDTVIVDAFVSKHNRLENELHLMFPKSDVLCEFHADNNHICVAAASVIAKVERDRAMEKLSEEAGIDLGTGYPHDQASTNYIRSYILQYGKAPLIARCSWITTQRIIDEVAKESEVSHN